MAQWCPDAVLPCELRRVNQLGGLFVSGCPLPDAKRRKIVELALCGLRAADISHQLKVSNGCVSKILTRYYKVGVVQPKTGGGSRPQITTPQLVAGIVQLKQEQPSLFAREIREKLEAAGTCAASRIPSVSSINRILRRLEAPGGSPFLRKLPQPGSPLAGEGERKDPAEAPTSPSSSRSAGAAGLPKTRSRTVFSKEQLEALETAFRRSQYPEAATWAELAGQSGLPEATLKPSVGQCGGCSSSSSSQRLRVNGSCPPGCSLPWPSRWHEPRLLLLLLPLLGIADPDTLQPMALGKASDTRVIGPATFPWPPLRKQPPPEQGKPRCGYGDGKQPCRPSRKQQPAQLCGESSDCEAGRGSRLPRPRAAAPGYQKSPNTRDPAASPGWGA
ncbi:paired box protein Pax-4 [Ahaetulla prasina]|uniref:paired box protein Pax-4 n=1 Tax=Ahaetulla prasina TaxID=499056 RepID=UPI00264A4134|nr:paired box protein Pax-4 [Ahaetulla prasina]